MNWIHLVSGYLTLILHYWIKEFLAKKKKKGAITNFWNANVLFFSFLTLNELFVVRSHCFTHTAVQTFQFWKVYMSAAEATRLLDCTFRNRSIKSLPCACKWWWWRDVRHCAGNVFSGVWEEDTTKRDVCRKVFILWLRTNTPAAHK